MVGNFEIALSLIAFPQMFDIRVIRCSQGVKSRRICVILVVEGLPKTIDNLQFLGQIVLIIQKKKNLSCRPFLAIIKAKYKREGSLYCCQARNNTPSRQNVFSFKHYYITVALINLSLNSLRRNARASLAGPCCSSHHEGSNEGLLLANPYRYRCARINGLQYISFPTRTQNRNRQNSNRRTMGSHLHVVSGV